MKFEIQNINTNLCLCCIICEIVYIFRYMKIKRVTTYLSMVREKCKEPSNIYSDSIKDQYKQTQYLEIFNM